MRQSIKIERLVPALESDYEQLNTSMDSGLLYGSLSYRSFLKRLLPQSEDVYLLAMDGKRIIGALPAFIAHGKLGPVINSLPFYGSIGGIVVAPDIDHPDEVKYALLEALDALAREVKAVCSLIINNPLTEDDTVYAQHAHATLYDERIGQLTPLPTDSKDDAELREKLISVFHSNPRRILAKAHKSELKISHSGDEEALQALYSIHTENMAIIGGLAKRWEVFAAIRDAFRYDDDYRVYIAKKDEQIVAALLVFFYHRTAEYFVPATSSEHRSLQPLSPLIFEGMQEAAKRGCTKWNWGGTWLTQDGVHEFKSRWGAQDIPYRYFIREYPEHGSLRTADKATLLQDYPYFYTLPFSALESPL